MRPVLGCDCCRSSIKSWMKVPCQVTLGKPWQNGYVESFNGRMRDELLK
jgi:hypothetical protein